MFIEVNDSNNEGRIIKLRPEAIDTIEQHELCEGRNGTFREPFPGMDSNQWREFTGSQIGMRNGDSFTVTQSPDEIETKCKEAYNASVQQLLVHPGRTGESN